jgi:hypothetical protein
MKTVMIIRGIFMTERAETPFRKSFLRRTQAPEVLSQKDASRNCVPELFPGIGITKHHPSPTEFWLTLCVPEDFLRQNSAGNNYDKYTNV